MNVERTPADKPNTSPADAPRRTRAGDGVLGVVGVIQREQEFLMIQRAEGILAGGAWCFPGGAVHNGERIEDGLIREMREEVGLDVRAGKRVWQWRRGDGALELEFWTAEIVGGRLRPQPAEVQRIEWMTREQIRSLDNVLPNLLAFLDGYGAD
jgi:8-oxo-dGTP pyrophosphatase MutT (NUDIX family)